MSTQAELEKKLEETNVKLGDEERGKMNERLIQKEYLPMGVHEVEIKKVELIEAKTGTLGIEFTVEKDKMVGSAKMWLSEAALPYTLSNIGQIAIHNAKPVDKDKMRTMVARLDTAKSGYEVASKMVGKKAFYVLDYDPKNKYENRFGEMVPSWRSRLLPYAPKAETLNLEPTEEVSNNTVEKTKRTMGGGEELDLSDMPF